MLPLDKFKDNHIAIFGLGLSGVAVARALKAVGATIYCWDDNEETVEKYRGELPIVDLYNCSFEEIEAIVFPPGMPLIYPRPHALVGKAMANNLGVYGDIELFALIRDQLPSHKVVGITGTNGKSTTSALLTHVLKECGMEAALGGNFGVPVMDLDPLPEGGVYVFELSSFQLDLMESLKCDVAILLNFAPDHLERHGSMEGYVEAKVRILTMMEDDKPAFIGVDDQWALSTYQIYEGRKHPVSVQRAAQNGVYVQSGILWDTRENGDVGPVARMEDFPNLPGLHNAQNIAFVYGTALELGLKKEDVVAALKSFVGLPHRMEQVATIEGVSFINDSKATNSHAAVKALTSYENIQWIAGGQYKEQSFGSFMGALKNVAKIWLIGSAAKNMADYFQGQVDCEIVETLDVATIRAFEAAKENNGTVLLSPACASFDQFKSFGDRGDQFKQMVADLASSKAGA